MSRILMRVGDFGSIRIKNDYARNTSKRFHWARIKTQAQADRANALYFGLERRSGIEDYLSQKVKVHIDARPFMRPAHEKNTRPEKLSKLFKDIIR